MMRSIFVTGLLSKYERFRNRPNNDRPMRLP
jgi:hypothetical protein